MAEFLIAFRHTIAAEGGYCNDPLDRGGETKYGISKRSYPDVDIENLTLGTAAEIYCRDFWDRLKLSEIHQQAIANELFDTAVNCGIGTAGRFVQVALNMLSVSGGLLAVDGIVGMRTILAINSYRHPFSLLKTLNGLQFERYHDIIKADPGQKKWFRGWLNRVWEV